MRSFIRLIHRRNGDIPLPERPMSAVHYYSGMASVMADSVRVSLYRTLTSRGSVRSVPSRDSPPGPWVGESTRCPSPVESVEASRGHRPSRDGSAVSSRLMADSSRV